LTTRYLPAGNTKSEFAGRISNIEAFAQGRYFELL
jgi:hypothetical protein